MDERLDKHAFYSWGMKEGASKREVLDKMIEEADAREYGAQGYILMADTGRI